MIHSYEYKEKFWIPLWCEKKPQMGPFLGGKKRLFSRYIGCFGFRKDWVSYYVYEIFAHVLVSNYVTV